MYVPDPRTLATRKCCVNAAGSGSLEAMLRPTGKLKTFRTEAVRAGFKSAWASRNCATIIEVALRLPEDVLHEDAALLMYYDNTVMRVGG